MSADRLTFAVRRWLDATAKDDETAVAMQSSPTVQERTKNATIRLLGAEPGRRQDVTSDEDNWRERVWVQR